MMHSKVDHDSLRSTQELAPLVAHTLRDATCCLLKRERKELLRQIHAFNTVLVTGRNGIPIYAQGQLDEDGQFQANNPLRWDVTMENCGSPFRLSNLKEVELRFGGQLVANFHGFSTHHYIHEIKYGQKEGMFHISFAPENIWIHLDIGWEKEELLALNHDEDSLVPLEFLTTVLPQEDDERICKIISVSTMVDKVKDKIPHALDPVQLEKNDLFIRIMDILRYHGHAEEVNSLARWITPEIYDELHDDWRIDLDDDDDLENIILDYIPTANTIRQNVRLPRF